MANEEVTLDFSLSDKMQKFFDLIDSDSTGENKQSMNKNKDCQEQSFQSDFDIIEKNKDQRTAGGLILPSDRPDLEGDVFKASVVENSAHKWMIKSQKMGAFHEVELNDVAIVESWTAKTDFDWNGEQIQKGDWCGVAKVFNDEAWKMVKEGKINGFSIEGKGLRRPVS